MSSLVLPIDPSSPDPEVIRRAAAVLRSGGTVAFPTETVYGLGANALDPDAVAGIFAAKGRPATNPLIVHVADLAGAVGLATDWPLAAAELADRFWPGPLTLVLPKRDSVPDIVTAGGPTVAVRCPNHFIALALIREAGCPVAAPSANRSTELSPTRAEHVLKSLDGRIDLILDGGPCPGGIESTVVDVTGGVVRLLRPGLVTVPMLEEVVGRVEMGVTGEGVARSPGQMVKHYSPRTPVVLTDADGLIDAVHDLTAAGRRIEGITFYGPAGFEMVGLVTLSADPEWAAARLYETLHRLDQQGFEQIVIEMPPDTPVWAAVRDRLTRAAAGG